MRRGASWHFSPPRETAHGDMATNAPLILAKAHGEKPRDIAGKLARRLEKAAGVAKVEIAGGGFVNLFLSDSVWQSELLTILEMGAAYGDSDIGRGQAVNIEYVSANPTGPLHIGHARGAVFGDVLAALMAKAGFDVTREYYVNDEGRQIDLLAQSVLLRAREVMGERVALGEGLYPGAYLIPVARELVDAYGRDLIEMAAEARQTLLRKTAVEMMMNSIKQELARLNIHHDVFTYESALHAEGRIDAAVARLAEKGLIYQGVLDRPKGKSDAEWEAKPQTLFRAAQFGDDGDRSVRTSDQRWTYLASDIAYHDDKYQRGFRLLVNVFGADHSGYVKRLKAVVAALSDGAARLDVHLMHIVRYLEQGEVVKMSKRSGRFAELGDLIDEIGASSLRFILLTRKHDAPLDVDIQTLKEQSNDNPVFYVQYAHARCCSVLRQAPPAPAPDRDMLARLSDAAELKLIKTLSRFPREVEAAALTAQPHRIAFYLLDLAAHFHALWSKGKENPQLKFIADSQAADDNILSARLALIRATQSVLANGLGVMGVQPLEEMR